EVLDADGLVSAMKEDVSKVRYPKKVRDLAQMEARAVDINIYVCHSICWLLQSSEHARTAFETRQSAYSPEDVYWMVAACVARQAVYDSEPAPTLGFVLEEAPLRRPLGDTMVWRGQLERLLEVGEMRNVTLQVMPTRCEVHPGLDGKIALLKFEDGSAV